MDRGAWRAPGCGPWDRRESDTELLTLTFTGFQVVVTGSVPKAAALFTPHLGSLGTGAQRKSSCRVVEESGMCQGLYLMLSCPSPAPQRNPKSSPNGTAEGAQVG